MSENLQRSHISNQDILNTPNPTKHNVKYNKCASLSSFDNILILKLEDLSIVRSRWSVVLMADTFADGHWSIAPLYTSIPLSWIRLHTRKQVFGCYRNKNVKHFALIVRLWGVITYRTPDEMLFDPVTQHCGCMAMFVDNDCVPSNGLVNLRTRGVISAWHLLGTGPKLLGISPHDIRLSCYTQ